MTSMGIKLGLVAIVASLGLGQGAALAASADKGKKLYVQYGCWGCHGFEGQGSVATSGGKVLAPEPMAWETFESFVRTTNRTMPPYRESVLPKADLEDIYAFLQTIPKPKDYKSIPLLNQ
ncbi:unnamed protein product [Phaeothamnion confervicola]